MYSAEDSQDISDSTNQTYCKKFIEMTLIKPAQMSINRLSRCASEANYLDLKKHRELMSNFLSALQENEKGFSSVDENEAKQLLNQFMLEVDAELISSKIICVAPDTFYSETINDALEKNEFLNKTECTLESKNLISYNQIQLNGLMSILSTKINNLTKDSTDPMELEELKNKLEKVKEVNNNLKKIVSHKNK